MTWYYNWTQNTFNAFCQLVTLYTQNLENNT
jgi:hypothetical protein